VLGPSGSGYLSGITAIASGHATVYALRSDGTVWAWGGNDYGEVGDNSLGTNADLPTEVRDQTGGAGTALTGVRSIAAGNDDAYAVTTLGNVFAWGYNAYGQVGDGVANAAQPYPAQVQRIGGGAGLTSISAVAAGNDYAVALTTGGSVLAWGDGAQGALGDGNTANQSLPVSINTGPGAVVGISVSGTTSFILRTG
jgi:alpha-tubulin suppressor-like RCC1 family protein